MESVTTFKKPEECPSTQIIAVSGEWCLSDMYGIEFEPGEVIDITMARLFKDCESVDSSEHLGTFWMAYFKCQNKFSDEMSVPVRNNGEFAWHNPTWPRQHRHKYSPGDQMAAHLNTYHALI